MDALQLLAGQADFATKNLAYNLDFIADDKLDWKPAPEANSALEIVHHLIGVIPHITALLRGAKEGTSPQEAAASEKPATREAAKEQLLAATKSYLEFLQTVTPEDMQKSVVSPFGKMPFWFMVGIVVTDCIHHHGQIAYIQTLLGDTEPHFDMSLLPS